MKSYIFRILTPAVVGLSLVIYLSPYSYDTAFQKRIVVSEVEVDASVEELFSYLGVSDNASEWSTFVEKIVPLNTDQYADGEVGSIRRCYGKKSGMQWDEQIEFVEYCKQRELSISNAKGFPLYVEGLRTHQVYEKSESGNSRLALTLYIHEDSLSLFDQLKFYIGAYKVKRIFDSNLINIKKNVESRSV